MPLAVTSGCESISKTARAAAPRESPVSRPKMGVALLVKLVVGVTHGFRLAAAEHHLEIDGRETVVLIAVNHAGRAGDAFPRAEPRRHPLAALVLDEDVEKALQHEKALLDLVRMRGVALARLHIHDREREVSGRNDRGVAMLAGAAGANEAMLRPLVALDLGILERRPIRRLLAKTADILFH